MLGVNDGRTLGAGSECMKALNFVRFCQFLFLRLGHFAVPATLYGSVALLISSPASAITFPNLYSLGLWHVVSETGQPQSVVSILCFHKISTDFYKCAWVCMCACVHVSVCTHPWEIPWTAEPVGYSPWSHKRAKKMIWMTTLNSLQPQALVTYLHSIYNHYQLTKYMSEALQPSCVSRSHLEPEEEWGPPRLPPAL